MDVHCVGRQIASGRQEVLHLTGQADHGRVRSLSPVPPSAAVLPSPTAWRRPSLPQTSSSRAGPQHWLTILAVGRPSNLTALPLHRYRHQWHNGEVLVKRSGERGGRGGGGKKKKKWECGGRGEKGERQSCLTT
jgi:hypothetical protein